MQVSWQELERTAPDLAAFGARRLTAERVSYLATVAPDGFPRLHPVTPVVAPGRLFLFMEASSPKGQDLDRGSPYALHCTVADDDGGDGEFRVRGTGRRVTAPDVRAFAAEHAPYDPSDEYVLFELLLRDAFSTVYDEDEAPIRHRWSASG